MSGAQSAVVLDHTALLALGAGSQLVSRMIASAHREPGRYVYAPAMCLAGAVAERPGLADHIGALLAVEVVDLGYAGRRGRWVDRHRCRLAYRSRDRHRPPDPGVAHRSSRRHRPPQPYDGWGVPIITLS